MVKASRFPRGVWGVVAIVLLCLAVCLTLLSLPEKGSLDPSALGMNNVPPVDQVANREAPQLDGTYYPFTLTEEADEEPVSTGLLTMLLLAASLLGARVFGWLHTNAQGQGALCFSSLGVGEVLGLARVDYLPFLGVYRL
jgi:hypothetical protein